MSPPWATSTPATRTAASTRPPTAARPGPSPWTSSTPAGHRLPTSSWTPNPDILYAATYDRLRYFWTYNIGGPGSGIHKSTDGGKTWTKLANGLPGRLLGRIGLTVYPKNPKILYAVIENVNKPNMSVEDRWKEILEGKSSTGMIDGEVYRTEDAGATWRKVSPEKQSIGGDPGYYYADHRRSQRRQARLHPVRRRPGIQGRRQDLGLAPSASAATTTPCGSTRPTPST